MYLCSMSKIKTMVIEKILWERRPLYFKYYYNVSEILGSFAIKVMLYIKRKKKHKTEGKVKEKL